MPIAIIWNPKTGIDWYHPRQKVSVGVATIFTGLSPVSLKSYLIEVHLGKFLSLAISMQGKFIHMISVY